MRRADPEALTWTCNLAMRRLRSLGSMLLGLLIALGPLAGCAGATVGFSAAAPGSLTVLTLFLTFDLVLFGAFTRLTDSGLGCPTGLAATAASPWVPVKKFLQRKAPCRQGPARTAKPG